MHILMVLDQNFPPDVRVENEAASLIAAGFEVSLLSICTDDRPAYELWRGIHIYRERLPKKVRNTMRGLVGSVNLYAHYLHNRIRKRYRKTPFHAIHAHDLYLLGGALRAGRTLRLPVVGDLHENYVAALQHYAWSTRFPGKYLVPIPRWKKLERRWVHAADHLIVVIEEAAARLEALGVPPAKLTVVSNTVQMKDFDAYPLQEAVTAAVTGDPVLVYTGGIDLHRGLESVLEALPGIKAVHPGVHLYIIGAGRTLGDLQAQAQALGVAGQVTFTGWQPQPVLKSYIAAADLCLIPHLKTAHTDATIPHKLFHYMYMGKPVVASNCLPIARILKETQAGIVYPSGQPEALQAAILKLMQHRTYWATMGRNGQAAVLQRYNWDVTAKALVNLYSRMNS